MQIACQGVTQFYKVPSGEWRTSACSEPHHGVNKIDLMACFLYKTHCGVCPRSSLFEKLIGVFVINTSGLSSWVPTKRLWVSVWLQFCSPVTVFETPFKLKRRVRRCFNDSCDFNQQCSIPNRSWRPGGLAAHINLSPS